MLKHHIRNTGKISCPIENKYNWFKLYMFILLSVIILVSIYSYYSQYFTVCAFQVIIIIVFPIESIVISYRKLKAFVYFEWIFFLYDSIYLLFLMHSNSYFITKIFYVHFLFYCIPTIIFTLKSQASFLKQC